jgi:hypothetical protein
MGGPPLPFEDDGSAFFRPLTLAERGGLIDDVDDDAKKKILARRARFVVAALAGVSAAVACGGETTATGDGGTEAGADASPMPCLSPPSQTDASADASDASTDVDAGPQPCLVPTMGVPPPRPPSR